LVASALQDGIARFRFPLAGGLLGHYRPKLVFFTLARRFFSGWWCPPKLLLHGSFAKLRFHFPAPIPMSDQPTIIFSMAGVSKIYPPQKQVLKNIYLSFFYGAKIGVLGLNGSGKSSLLKIIAGVDKQFQGEVFTGLLGRLPRARTTA
jgi:ABC-type multidrug transport system fused ATPase/permease subunit